MARKHSKETALPEWAEQVTTLRERLKINQAELARRMDCSAMTVSRWERGLLKPSAEHFIQLGNLGTQRDAWYFWEKAGIRAAKMIDVLRETAQTRRTLDAPSLEAARAGAARATSSEKTPDLVGLPILRAVIGSHGVQGDRRSNLHTIAASQVVGAPATWCPNPHYTSLLRVKGHSMGPLIRQGDILAVDSFQTERSELYDKIVVASNDEKGLSVSRLRRYENLDVLEAENHEYPAVVLNKTSGWRVLGRVLWWISAAP